MKVVALAGGTGGAKLAHGLQQVLSPGDLHVIVNTGDDTVRHGLLVMPDHDAVLYMLSGRFDDERGWGIAGETWTVMDALTELGEPDWFRLGDRDFATHIARTARIRAGATLTEAVLALQAALGIPTRILPMTDAAVPTQVRTDEGWLDFQEYFVHQRQAPDVREIRFAGIEAARPTEAVTAALAEAEVVVIGPSNPLVSIGPILAVPGMTDLLAAARSRGVPVIAVSGIVGGVALKGPADRMLTALGFESSARGVAAQYAPGIDGFVLDTVDAALEPAIAGLGLRTLVTDTIMADHAGRARFAEAVLAFAAALAGSAGFRGHSPWVRGHVPGASGHSPGSRHVTSIAAIIPVGTFEGAKSRLGDALDAEERQDLVEGLLDRTVDAVLAVDGLGDVLVVSPDRAVLRRAANLGARTLRQRTVGLNAGLREARADVIAGGADAVLVLPIDLPFVDTAAITNVADALERAEVPQVVLVTDHHGTGTNALGLRPADVIDFAFGPGSRQAHRAAAVDAGAAYLEIDGPLAIDLDTPDDLVYVESVRQERLGVG